MAANIENTLGICLVAIVVSACMLGIVLLQTWNYFLTFSQDPLLTKTTVISLCLIDTTRVALNAHGLYHYLIFNYGNPGELMIPVKTTSIGLGLTVTITLIVQTFYAYRCYHMTGRKPYVPAVVMIVALAHLGLGWALVAEILSANRLANYLHLRALERAMLTTAMVADITITACLCYCFQMGRAGVEGLRTEHILNKLTLHTLNNNLLVAVMDIVVLIYATLKTETWIYIALFQLVGNFYNNSFMATLNSRTSLSARHTAAHTSSGGRLSFHRPIQSQQDQTGDTPHQMAMHELGTNESKAQRVLV